MKLKQVTQIDLAQLEALYAQVGWCQRPRRKLQQLIRQSWLCIAIYQKQQLIGFGRVVSDHTWNATIWDVVIHPDYQRKGLGKYLVYQMIRFIKRQDITQIHLFAESRALSFYQRIGFDFSSKGMFWFGF
jgi:ribosomal protein S18 acetylase RimI-like enzyme|uniref:GNAT family acetyltransferase n=1 Tax=Cyanidiaceae sp. MX-AZ01 TaxID=1503164 RepID=A0A060A979_9RHOD|nr:GNAT family acetyltransferase [Cyanidiaceae sp. MX-AZ01]UNJ15427.1 GCN5-like N-acetyltransferase [Cyanidioschyzonaceae sp. 1]